MSLHFRMISGICLALTVAQGCSVHKVQQRVEPPVEVPGGWTDPAAKSAGGQPEDRAWWQDFGDPALDALIAELLEQSPSLHQAWARLDQARAGLAQGKSGYYPEVTASANLSRARSVAFVGGFVGTIDQTKNRFGLDLGVSYEVDLWGRVSNAVRAARQDLRASRADLETMATSLSAEVARAWYALAAVREQEALLQAQVEVGRTFQSLVELRFGQGMATAVDVFQQRQQVAALEGQLPALERQEALLRHQLAALVGVAPGSRTFAAATSLPALPPLPSLGVPARLLQARPDLRAALNRIRAADHRVGVAVADRFPALRLSAGTGVVSQEPQNLFNNWIWNLAANLVGPLFDGGRRKAEVDRREAQMR